MNRLQRRVLEFAGAAVAVLACASAWAQWNGHASGRIQSIEVTQLNNYPFRVHLEGNPAMCTAGHNWAYLDGSGSNYKVYVATLLTAKARNANVSIYTTHDSSAQSYCVIGHISMND